MNSRKNLDFLNGNMNIVGSTIESYREKANMSRQELSDQLILKGLDVTAQAIFKIEKGMRTVVDYELCAIAFVLKIPADKLLKEYRDYLENN